MSMPVNGDYTFYIDKLKVPTHERAPLPPPLSLPLPYSAMWLAHECQTTWQNMEMDTGKFINLQDSGRWNRYVCGRKTVKRTFIHPNQHPNKIIIKFKESGSGN